MNIKWILLSTLLAITGCSPMERSRNLGDTELKGQVIAQQVCSACHGVTGNSVSPEYPKLAAQQPEYLIRQMDNFKEHARTDRLAQEVMAGMVRHLTDRQKSELAVYFNRQRASSEAVQDQDQRSAGLTLYRQGQVLACVNCHGVGAEGNGPIPRLAGQHAPYLIKQLKVFRDHHGREGTPMTDTTQTLSDQDITALATYLSGL